MTQMTRAGVLEGFLTERAGQLMRMAVLFSDGCSPCGPGVASERPKNLRRAAFALAGLMLGQIIKGMAGHSRNGWPVCRSR
jgi:hypothetical protein